jgi:hypothetical protein
MYNIDNNKNNQSTGENKMNANEIMNTAISHSSPELDEIKAKMTIVIEKMLAYVPALREKGMSELDILTSADNAIRKQFSAILNGKKDYFVTRDGKTAILGLGITTANAIVEMVEREIKK